MQWKDLNTYNPHFLLLKRLQILVQLAKYRMKIHFQELTIVRQAFIF